MFAKLLIANRGEIAVRVIRACRDLDITPVAVYSDLDAGALHTQLADEAYNIGPGPAAESYLNIGAIVSAARRCGAEAVHPGYGFLAENSEFAAAVIDASLTWVGPPPEVIDAMGDKTAARRAAGEAGIDVVPGTSNPVTRTSEVSAFAAEHGFPVAIKASAGGGGRGFRVVASDDDLESALTGAQREARASFSSESVYLERYLEHPRHVEVQVLGDASGAILSFPERDCSLQRRHQKLVEESPSPALGEGTRQALMEAATRVSKQIGYRNAGTCEFLLDEHEESFYFLEMNTRLQVEHPLTELVCGVDLVEAQLLIAAREGLGLDQGDIGLTGHAIECRINAEDARHDFMPVPGTIDAYREPSGPGVRVDSGCTAGSVIPQAYDSLVAKLICNGSTRQQARSRALRALAEFRIDGITTTVGFHRHLLSEAGFVAGKYHTGTVEHEIDLTSIEPDPGRPDPAPGRPRIAVRRFEIELNDKRFSVVANEELETNVRARKPEPPATGGHIGTSASEVLSAPMQGTIVQLLVEVGDEVSAGKVICVLEAMKMENSILAHVDGRVDEVLVEAGQSVEAGAVIAVIR
jgi:acetyl-CoA/propionyl-CoA carboxylase, biotin carboxylase, biotin carboxyl carrier protein